MDFRYKRTKTFLTIIYLFIIGNTFAINTETPILHEITIENKNLLSVKVYAPMHVQNNCYFTFQNATPNYYLEENNINKIKNFTVVLNNGQMIYHKSAKYLKIEEDFEYIFYQFEVEDIDSASFLPVNNLLEKELFLNFSSFLGSFNTDTLNEIKVHVFKNKRKIFSATNQFKYFVNNPFCQGTHFELKFKNTQIAILANDANFVATVGLKKLIAGSLKALSQYGFLEKFKNRQMIFLFNQVSKNSGAITKSDNIVFHFNTTDPYIIQKTIIHELLHWIVPSQQSWLNEAVPEYLAIKTMLQSDLITKQKFLEIMSGKIKLANRYKNIDLAVIYNNPKYYKALYSKGAISAWFMDLNILQATNYQISLEQYLLDTESLSEQQKHQIIPELIFFKETYIQANKAIPFNNYLASLGILYNRKIFKEIKAKQTIKLLNSGEKIIISDPAKFSCLQVNDIVLAIDGKRKKTAIYEKFRSLSNKKSRLTIYRDKQKHRFTINNDKSLMEKIQFDLDFLSKPNEQQTRNWLRFVE